MVYSLRLSVFKYIYVTASGELTWTPTDVNSYISFNLTLTVQVSDGKGGTALLTIPIQLCVCKNNQSCLYNETTRSVDNYQVIILTSTIKN